MNDDYAKGASASINKTIDEIERILQGNQLTSAGKLRTKLRSQLEEALEKVAHEWLEHGFNGGHIVAAKRFAKTKKFPRSIKVDIARKFPIRGVSDSTVEISLKSRLPKDIAAKLNGDA